jgi:hypothetical protein
VSFADIIIYVSILLMLMLTDLIAYINEYMIINPEIMYKTIILFNYF